MIHTKNTVIVKITRFFSLTSRILLRNQPSCVFHIHLSKRSETIKFHEERITKDKRIHHSFLKHRYSYDNTFLLLNKPYLVGKPTKLCFSHSSIKKKRDYQVSRRTDNKRQRNPSFIPQTPL